MESAVDQIELALARADPIAIVRAKQLYYKVLIEDCGSTIIGKYLLQFIAMTSFSWGSSLSKPGRAAESVFEVRRLIEAIRARDPERAAAASETFSRHAASIGLQAGTAVRSPLEGADRDIA